MRILISTITKANIHADTVSWFLNEQLRSSVSIVWDIVKTPKTITHNRNLQISRLLSSDFDYIFFLDSDNVPQANTINRLCAHLPKFEGKDVMLSAPSDTAINGEHGILALDKVSDGYTQHRPMKGLQMVDAVGCAGMLIPKYTFGCIEKPYFMERYTEEGLLECGEDFAFCEKLIDSGFSIYADFDLWQEHRI